MDVQNQPEPLTIESVQAQLDAERTAHQSTKDQLAVALESKADAADALSQASEIITGQKQTIDELEKRLADLQTSPSEFATIVVDKVSYEVQAKKIKFKGVDVTVAQLLKDKSLQKELVKLGAGFLVKKEG